MVASIVPPPSRYGFEHVDTDDGEREERSERHGDRAELQQHPGQRRIADKRYEFGRNAHSDPAGFHAPDPRE
jgi:hypothetical protein